MKTKIYILLVLMMVMLIFVPTTQAASRQYTIDSPYITKRNKTTVVIEWDQHIPNLIVVYKVSDIRPEYSNCPEEYTPAKYCRVISTLNNVTGRIRVKDVNYKKGDRYYIFRYFYKTMLEIYPSREYGPFTPK